MDVFLASLKRRLFGLGHFIPRVWYPVIQTRLAVATKAQPQPAASVTIYNFESHINQICISSLGKHTFNTLTL